MERQQGVKQSSFPNLPARRGSDFSANHQLLYDVK